MLISSRRRIVSIYTALWQADGMNTLVEPGAGLELLFTGTAWGEGPAWLPATRRLRFSDIPNDRILEYDPVTGRTTVHRSGVEFVNGRTLDRELRVVQCSHGLRRIEREHDGVVTPIVSRWAGGRFNSPNDVVVAADGSIWFTDPPYGIHESGREGHPGVSDYGACYVFRHDEATGETAPVITDMVHPNGLAFSPDERRLYVSDSASARDPDGNHHILVLDVIDGCRLASPRVFAVIEPGLPDGLRVDEHGNVWTSAHDGVYVLDPEARELGRIGVPEKTANLVFGGADGRRLFITASSSLYAIDVLVRGAGVAAAVARGEAV
jgi:gluconolactonase